MYRAPHVECRQIWFWKIYWISNRKEQTYVRFTSQNVQSFPFLVTSIMVNTGPSANAIDFMMRDLSFTFLFIMPKHAPVITQHAVASVIYNKQSLKLKWNREVVEKKILSRYRYLKCLIIFRQYNPSQIRTNPILTELSYRKIFDQVLGHTIIVVYEKVGTHDCQFLPKLWYQINMNQVHKMKFGV